MKYGPSRTERVLTIWGIVLILWSLYRWYFRTDLPIWFDEFISKPLIFLLPVYYFVTKTDKQSFFAGIDLTSRKLKQNILLGLGIGLIFFVIGGLAAVLRTPDLNKFTSLVATPAFLVIVLTAFATSFSEEVVSRGFVLKRLYEESKNPFMAAIIASFLFFLLHVPILFTDTTISGGVLLRVMVTDILLSLAVSFIYLDRKSLIVPIFIHAFYTLSLLLFI